MAVQSDPMARSLDAIARMIFQIALRDDRCGELLAHLFDGGGVTLDAATGRLVLIPAATIAELAAGEEPGEATWCPHGVNLRAPCGQCTEDKLGPNDPWEQAQP